MSETAFLVASIALSAGAAVYQGRMQAKAEAIMQRSLLDQAEASKIRALDDEIERRRQLALALGEGQALGAMSGFDPNSAGSSFLALRDETIRLANKDVNMIRLLGANQLSNYNSQISQSRIAATSAITGSYLKAGAAIAGGGNRLLATRTPDPGGFTGFAVHSGGTR